MNFFSGFLIFAVAVSVIAVGIIIAAVAAAVRRKRRNDRSPILTVAATVAEKHTDVTYQRHAVAGDISGGHGFHTIPTYRYTVSFETAEQGRVRLLTDKDAYDYLHEGDAGRLTYQGDRFLRFDNN